MITLTSIWRLTSANKFSSSFGFFTIVDAQFSGGFVLSAQKKNNFSGSKIAFSLSFARFQLWSQKFKKFGLENEQKKLTTWFLKSKNRGQNFYRVKETENQEWLSTNFSFSGTKVVYLRVLDRNKWTSRISSFKSRKWRFFRKSTKFSKKKKWLLVRNLEVTQKF